MYDFLNKGMPNEGIASQLGVKTWVVKKILNGDEEAKKKKFEVERCKHRALWIDGLKSSGSYHWVSLVKNSVRPDNGL